MRPRQPSSSHAQSSGRQSLRFHPLQIRPTARPVRRRPSFYEVIELPNNKVDLIPLNEDGTPTTPDQSSDASGDEPFPLAESSANTSGDEAELLAGSSEEIIAELRRVSVPAGNTLPFQS